MLNTKFDKNKNGVDDRLDILTNFCSIILPLTTIPQIYLIYVEKQTAGVSALTWFLYGLLNIPLLVYSLKRKDHPMIILNGFWVVIDWIVWVGILLNS